MLSVHLSIVFWWSYKAHLVERNDGHQHNSADTHGGRLGCIDQYSSKPVGVLPGYFSFSVSVEEGELARAFPRQADDVQSRCHLSTAYKQFIHKLSLLQYGLGGRSR